MALSRPPSSGSRDQGWGMFSDDPLAEDEDDTRTIQVSSPLFKGAPSPDQGASDERATMPPPVPVSDYVRMMMQQAADEPAPTSIPLSSPFAWQGAAASSAARGGGSDVPASPRAPRIAGWSARRQAIADDDDDGFTLIAFEPERLGDAAGDLDDPRYSPAVASPSGFDDLPFDDAIEASQGGSSSLGFPSPLPVYPSPLAAMSSRREPPPESIPPILGDPWATAAAELEELEDFEDLDDPRTSPPTKPGLSALAGPARANPGTHDYGAIGDASVTPKTSSSRGAPIRAPRPAPPPTPPDPFDDVRELYDAGDFRSALVMAEALLETEPTNADAIACAASCRETLTEKYLSRLGGLSKKLHVAMPPDEIRGLSLDHKAGFLLSCIDGASTIEEVLDVACMQEFEAIRILHDFRELGVIEILPDLRGSRR